MDIRRCFTLSLLALALAAPALALSPVNKTLFGGLAIDGYDPVAYFTDGRAVEGSRAHAFEWNGATWRFASAAHRELFIQAPERYAPQYGGYCAWAVAQGYTADIDPQAWRIENGRLFLNYSPDVLEKWSADIPGNVAKADANWPMLSAAD